MDRSTLKTMLAAMKKRVPVILWGEPGIGKSATMKQIGEALGCHVETYIASLRDITDAAGVPYVYRGEMKQSVPTWLKNLLNRKNEDCVILFLDEITTADKTQQAFLLRVTQERVAGDVELPENVMIVAAANPPEIAAGGSELSAPLANRFLHLDVLPDKKGFQTYIKDRYISQQQNGVKEQIMQVIDELDHPKVKPEKVAKLVLKFLEVRPDYQHNFPKDEQDQALAWPSPRMWENLIKVLHLLWGDKEAMGLAACGCVGKDAGLEFLNYIENLDLNSPQEILDNLEDWELPSEDKLMANIESVLGFVEEQEDLEYAKKAWDMILKIKDSGRKDLAYMMMSKIIRNDDKNHDKMAKAFELPEIKDKVINIVTKMWRDGYGR